MNEFESKNARIIVKIVSNELGLVYAKNISKFIEFMRPTVVLYYYYSIYLLTYMGVFGLSFVTR